MATVRVGEDDPSGTCGEQRHRGRAQPVRSHLNGREGERSTGNLWGGWKRGSRRKGAKGDKRISRNHPRLDHANTAEQAPASSQRVPTSDADVHVLNLQHARATLPSTPLLPTTCRNASTRGVRGCPKLLFATVRCLLSKITVPTAKVNNKGSFWKRGQFVRPGTRSSRAEPARIRCGKDT